MRADIVSPHWGAKVNKNELVAAVADSTGLSKADSGKAVDAVFDPDLSLWDFAPSLVILREAGGKALVRETGSGRGHDVLLGTPAIVDELAELLEF